MVNFSDYMEPPGLDPEVRDVLAKAVFDWLELSEGFKDIPGDIVKMAVHPVICTCIEGLIEKGDIKLC